MTDYPTQKSRAWRDIHYSSFDGLRLYARHYPAVLEAHGDKSGAAAPGRPLVCLSGVSRSSPDFDDLALLLSTDKVRPREVYALDYRGRGQSQWDKDPKNYTPFVEARDVLDFFTITGLHHAAVLGTSRGGILAMIIAAVRPGILGPVILNDMGPTIESTGLLRLMGHIGKTPVPASWDDAVRIMKNLHEQQFTSVEEHDWDKLARQTYLDVDGRPAPSFDEKVSQEFSNLDLSKGPPDLWPQFIGLMNLPMLVLRGELSDILSADTASRMAKFHRNCRLHTVKGQGHAPLLIDRPTLDVISAFLQDTDDT